MKPKDPQNPHGWVTVGKYRVKVDVDMCIGAATCAAIAIKTFHINQDAKAIILDSAGEDPDESVVDAAKSCPTSAIIIETLDGKRVYPK